MSNNFMETFKFFSTIYRTKFLQSDLESGKK
jgi:hypothetical protein